MKTAKTRNWIAILAITLTAVLFTSLFTIAMSINDSFQQANFRQVGGFSHGGFKYLTEEQFEELKDDPMIKEWGLRRFIGMPTDVPFNKNHVEIGYSDANQAHWMYCDPVEGRLPQENTDEAATDTEVLELLGVEPKIGAKFTVTFDVDGKQTTQTFTLCGWWEADEITVANHILIPESRVNSILNELNITPPGSDGMTGEWNLDIMLSSAMHIEDDLHTILQNHGYQNESRSEGDNYIRIGVNWGYTGTQIFENIDPQMVIAIVVLVLLIIFTGYLIIYNVFQISVANDIRFYGLLKTIGTTGKQIKRIIRQQALLLSLIGIPLGLVIGWFVGGKLTPVILNQLDGVMTDVVSVNPIIFIISAVFALLTVLISCYKPGHMAAKVSPIEALRYTEGTGGKKKSRRSGKGISLFSMAKANLGRNRGKTVITILSLSLAVVLLNMTVSLANSFDMDKYLRDVVSDFIVADASYFQTSNPGFSTDAELSKDVIDQVTAQDGVEKGGRIYGVTSPVQEFITEDYYRSIWKQWNDEETLDAMIKGMEHTSDGLLADNAQLYGMERYALDKMKVLDGDISKLYKSGSHYIAAVYAQDDNGKAYEGSNWAKLGDTITLRYVEEFEYYNPNTGEIYEKGMPEDDPYAFRAVKYRDEQYTVAALISVPTSLSYRYYGADEFVMNDQTFIQDTGTDSVMLYACDTTDQGTSAMESFLSDYTENENPQIDYESKQTYTEEFESTRSMFMLLGSTLSFIVALVGILNFFNAILTGIITRKREFAVLQSIGMTGKQLKGMLMWEGVFYALSAILLALLLILACGPFMVSAIGGMFWFFTYHFTITPALILTPLFALLGCIVPLGVYRSASKATIVERLRETE